MGNEYALGPIHLEGAFGVLALCLVGYWAARGSIEILIPIQLVLNQWTRTVFFLGVPHLYVISGAVLVACVTAFLRRPARRLYLRNHHWAMPWFVASVLWYLTLSLVFGDPGYGTRMLVINVALVVPVLWLHLRAVDQVRVFARTYVATALLGGVLAIQIALAQRAPEVLWQDPFMRSGDQFRYLSEHYHFLAAPFSLSVVLAWTLGRDTNRRVARILWGAAAVCCVYVLILIGSRQHLLSAFVGAVALALQAQWRGASIRKARALVAATALVVVSVFAAASRPDLVLREAEGSTFNASSVESIADQRTWIWKSALARFAQSPIVGGGPNFNGHNVVLGTLANQGIVGFGLLVGWLLFACQVLRTSLSAAWDRDSARWQHALLVIAGMALVAGQASGDMASLWYLYWAPTLAWCLQARARRGARLRGTVVPPGRPTAHRPSASPGLGDWTPQDV